MPLLGDPVCFVISSGTGLRYFNIALTPVTEKSGNFCQQLKQIIIRISFPSNVNISKKAEQRNIAREKI